MLIRVAKRGYGTFRSERASGPDILRRPMKPTSGELLRACQKESVTFRVTLQPNGNAIFEPAAAVTIIRRPRSIPYFRRLYPAKQLSADEGLLPNGLQVTAKR